MKYFDKDAKCPACGPLLHLSHLTFRALFNCTPPLKALHTSSISHHSHSRSDGHSHRALRHKLIVSTSGVSLEDTLTCGRWRSGDPSRGSCASSVSHSSCWATAAHTIRTVASLRGHSAHLAGGHSHRSGDADAFFVVTQRTEYVQKIVCSASFAR